MAIRSLTSIRTSIRIARVDSDRSTGKSKVVQLLKTYPKKMKSMILIQIACATATNQTGETLRNCQDRSTITRIRRDVKLFNLILTSRIN